MPDPIRIQALLCKSYDVPGTYIAHTTYRLVGRGDSLDGARRSAQSVVFNHISTFAMLDQSSPQPDQQLRSIDDVVYYFSKFMPPGSRVVRDEDVRQAALGRVPELCFEFYRVDGI